MYLVIVFFFYMCKWINVYTFYLYKLKIYKLEKNHAQIEKETLSIVFGVGHLYEYIFAWL